MARRWKADLDASAYQMDWALRLIGVGPGEMDAHSGSITCALAVIQAIQDGEDLDPEVWRTIKLRHVTVTRRTTDEDDDPADPS